MRAIAVFALALVGTGVCAGSLGAKENMPVILDQWWNLDMAKEACRQVWTDQNTATCLTDFANFDRAVITQFAADMGCQGVEIVRYTGPSTSKTNAEMAAKQQHWNLSYNWESRARSLPWKLLNSHTKQLFEGEGTPREIALETCAIVRGSGAFITR